MTDKIYYVDGQFVPADQASIPVQDLAIVRGYGVFDFFRTYNGKPIQVERNLRRFRDSAAYIGLDIPWPDAELERLIDETLARNGFDEAGVRLIATGGDADNFITPNGNPRLLIYVEPLKPMPDEWYNDGVKVITVEEERYMPQSKNLNYIPAILAQKQAKVNGAIEALYKDRAGIIREGTTTNIFAYYGGGRVVTPAVDILPGITRGRVLEILADDYTVEETPLSYDDLLAADELIITAANKQVIPVVQVDDHTYGDAPGPWGQKIVRLFHEYVMAAADARDTQATL
jgi:branched-chain amino acid aminotransferase